MTKATIDQLGDQSAGPDHDARRPRLRRRARRAQRHVRPSPEVRDNDRCLVDVKRAYDPDNVFHLDQHIDPRG